MKDILDIHYNGELKRVDNSLIFVRELDNKKISIPINKINVINIYSNVKFSSQLIYFLNSEKVSINFFNSFSENYTGSFIFNNNKNSAVVLYSQLKEYENNRKYYINKIFNSIIENSIFIMKDYQKNVKYGKKITLLIKELKKEQKQLPLQKINLSDYMLYEAKLWNIIYKIYDIVLINNFKFEKRTKMPPENEINSLISFINMKLYYLIDNTIKTTQIDSRIGFLHELQGNRFSLSLDLAEMFKPYFTIKFILKIINTKKILKKDFEKNFMLKKSKLKDLNNLWREYIEETVYHPQLKRKISYKYMIKIEIYKLIKKFFNIEQDYKAFLLKEYF